MKDLFSHVYMLKRLGHKIKLDLYTTEMMHSVSVYNDDECIFVKTNHDSDSELTLELLISFLEKNNGDL